MTKVILGLPSIPRPDHAADALAVAITHTHACAATLPPEITEARSR
jgi:crossover junction endodeoxyribonuclease RuvC